MSKPQDDISAIAAALGYTMAEWRARLDYTPPEAAAPKKGTRAPAAQPAAAAHTRPDPPKPEPAMDRVLEHMFNTIKKNEADMVAADAKRVADAAAAGNPIKELSFDELLTLRRKFEPRDEGWCPAAAGNTHVWSPLRHSGNSWHGPVYSKDCTACGYGWCSH